MSLLTHAHLLDRYGPLLTIDQLSQVIHLAPGTIKNRHYAGTLGIRVVGPQKAFLFAAADVADYIDRIAEGLAA